jgi:hypothetical protein
MSNEARRIRRLRLLVGIIIGVFAGTAHALVTHVVSRLEPDVAVVQPHTPRAPGTDVSAR